MIGVVGAAAVALIGTTGFAITGNEFLGVKATSTEYSVTVDRNNPFFLDATLSRYYLKTSTGYRIYFAEYQGGLSVVTDSSELASGVLKNTTPGQGIYFDHGRATVIGDDSKTYYQGFASCTGIKITWDSSAVGAVAGAYNGDGTWLSETTTATNSTRLTSTGSTRFWWHVAGAANAYITSVVFYYTGC